ncbi:MAG: PIN domain-containing protein [Candidatus Methanoperedens sp.]
MHYLDTSVLLAYTLFQDIEKDRYVHVSKLFELMNERKIKTVTSFYALHELFMIAIQNSPDLETGSKFGKEAKNKILETNIILAPLLNREQRILHAQKVSSLKDSSDVPHAISAIIYKCEAIVAYDNHFRAIDDVIPYLAPEDVVKEY